jgi:hypothetical protein
MVLARSEGAQTHSEAGIHVYAPTPGKTAAHAHAAHRGKRERRAIPLNPPKKWPSNTLANTLKTSPPTPSMLLILKLQCEVRSLQ